MNIIDVISKEHLRSDIPEFAPGDVVKVYVKVKEGNRERLQVFEGVVLRRSNGGLNETFTVRKISGGIGVERTFPIHSPMIDRIDRVRPGKSRRAKLYYLCRLLGKEARIDEWREG